MESKKTLRNVLIRSLFLLLDRDLTQLYTKFFFSALSTSFLFSFFWLDLMLTIVQIFLLLPFFSTSSPYIYLFCVYILSVYMFPLCPLHIYISSIYMSPSYICPFYICVFSYIYPFYILFIYISSLYVCLLHASVFSMYIEKG